jgi:hypothetical protein
MPVTDYAAPREPQLLPEPRSPRTGKKRRKEKKKNYRGGRGREGSPSVWLAWITCTSTSVDVHVERDRIHYIPSLILRATSGARTAIGGRNNENRVCVIYLSPRDLSSCPTRRRGPTSLAPLSRYRQINLQRSATSLSKCGL